MAGHTLMLSLYEICFIFEDTHGLQEGITTLLANSEHSARTLINDLLGHATVTSVSKVADFSGPVPHPEHLTLQ